MILDQIPQIIEILRKPRASGDDPYGTITAPDTLS